MTIAGKHTIAELRDIVRSYDYQFDQLSRAYDGARGQWVTSGDVAGADGWKRDFDAWNASSWQPARTHANTVLAATSTFMQDIETDEDTYQATAAAFLPMADLDRRFRAGPAASKAPTYQNSPQPLAHDADLGAYKAADAGTRAMPDVVKSGIANFAPGLVPKTADQANYRPMSTTTKVLLALGAAVGLGVVIKVAK